jgi:hypothetical protein
MKPRYQDLVIKNGKFIGKFEQMYQKFSDPWNLVKDNKFDINLNYKIIYNYCDLLKQKKKINNFRNRMLFSSNFKSIIQKWF